MFVLIIDWFLMNPCQNLPLLEFSDFCKYANEYFHFPLSTSRNPYLYFPLLAFSCFPWWPWPWPGNINTWTQPKHLAAFKDAPYCLTEEAAMSPDWNCQWGPSGARIAYTRAMSEHRCFLEQRLSIHTMHLKWHHRNLSKNDHESLETNHEWRHAFIINTKK